MQDTNLEITGGELAAMQDTSFFDVKAAVMKKISAALAGLKDQISENVSQYERQSPGHVFDHPGKISRGENYRGYPYLVLDYPRNFNRDEVFAYRCMFWWGHHFSYTLHVSGSYYEKATDNFIRNYSMLKLDDVFVCVNAQPWEYHFETGNFLPASQVDPVKLLEGKTGSGRFIKLSLRTGLHRWNEIKTDGLRAFDLFSRVLYS